jgi:hypothetical protein
VSRHAAEERATESAARKSNIRASWANPALRQTITQAIRRQAHGPRSENGETYEPTPPVHWRTRHLDTLNQTIVDSAARKTVLSRIRVPFRYLADDYGLTYTRRLWALGETEASFEPCVPGGQGGQLIPSRGSGNRGATHDIAETVVRRPKQRTQNPVMTSLPSVTSEDLAKAKPTWASWRITSPCSPKRSTDS